VHPVVAREAPELYRRGGGERWGLSFDLFTEAVQASVTARFGSDADASNVRAYLGSLHVEDLALACACRAGSDAAWEHFVRELRPGLYAAARAIAGEDGRDLADGLYGDLFGLPGPGGRKSLLAWYHGRSRLLTWLRSVLAQRRIDQVRAGRRFEPLDDSGDDARFDRLSDVPAPDPDPDRQDHVRRAQQALDRAIAALDPSLRLHLRLYYAEELTLAQIGRALGAHEATASRKLERARVALRKGVERELRAGGLSDTAVHECLERAASAPELHLTRLLSRAEDG